MIVRLRATSGALDSCARRRERGSLPLVLSPGAALAWLGVGAAATALATLVPARRASALVVREALGRT